MARHDAPGSASLELPNPVLTASGCAAAGRELHQFFDVADARRRRHQVDHAAAAVGTADAADGRDAERHAQLDRAAGPGHRRRSSTTTWPGWPSTARAPWSRSPAAHTDEFVELARRLAGHPAVSMLEVNISCPNVESRGQVFACDAIASSRVIGAVRRAADPAQPVFAKLSPDVTDITLHRPRLRRRRRRRLLADQHPARHGDRHRHDAPALGGVTGGLSGPAIRPVAVRCVWQVHQALPHLPILGMGGIRTGLDALQFVLAGASAVSVGTAVFGDPSAPVRVLAELEQALDERGFASPGRRRRLRPPDRRSATRTPPSSRTGMTLRRAARRRARRARAAVRRHRPAPGAARGVGTGRRRRRAGPVRRHLRRRVRRHGRGGQAAVGVLRAVRRRAGIAVLERTVAGVPGRRRAGACSTSSAATSARRWPRTRAPTSTRPRRWRATRSRSARTSASARCEPAFDLCARHGAGVFVLALTSNPEGPQVQHARADDGRTVAQTVVDELAARNAGAAPLGVARRRRRRDDRHGGRATSTPSTARILVPGVGAQGGTADDVRRIFGDAPAHVVPERVARGAAARPGHRGAARRRRAPDRRIRLLAQLIRKAGN